jgi:hypothetical protein
LAEFIIQNTMVSRYFSIDKEGESALVSLNKATGFGSQALAFQALALAAKASIEKKKDPPKWALAATGKSPEELEGQSLFRVSTRPTLSDLVGVFESYFVRCQSGWLSRPHQSSRDGSLGWNKSFAFAVPFPDLASARHAMSSARGDDSVSIIKSSSVFTEVIVDARATRAVDDTAAAIRTACDARDISAELSKAASERMDAMSSAAPKQSDEPQRRARL